jgi:hypothetical protein
MKGGNGRTLHRQRSTLDRSREAPAGSNIQLPSAPKWKDFLTTFLLFRRKILVYCLVDNLHNCVQLMPLESQT